VWAGVLCVSVAPAEATVLLFVTASVYVMFAPVAAGFGAAVSVTERSAYCTVAVAENILLAEFGSYVVEDIAAEPVIPVPTAAPALTVTVIPIVAVPPLANAAPKVHVSVPVPPTATPPQVMPPEVV
jgi:hypothetical protein